MKLSENILDLVDITLVGQSDRKIFENLNFGLSEGKTAIVSGPTGSGKSQLVRLIIGDLAPDSGSVFAFGNFVKSDQPYRLPKIRRKIGGVGGAFNLVANLTVKENLMHPLILNKRMSAFQQNKITQILNRFDLLAKSNEKAGYLSQGEKNEVMLARAIIADQPLLLIDEPLAGVDPAISEKIKLLLIRLSTAGHSMIIFTSNPDQFGIPQSLMFRIEKGRLT